MKNIIVIGLTGRSGAGKTTVSNLLMLKGIPVLNCDNIARKVVKPGSPCLAQLKNYFGDGIIKADGSLNRKKLAAIAFSEKSKTELLNHITHSYILEDMNKTIENYAKNGHTAIVVDASQLFESGFDKMCDLIVSVTADDELLRSRISRRDNINECRADDRLACQLDNDFFVKHSDYIINNNGTTDELEAEVAKAIRFCIDRLRAMKNAEEK